ncbi:MAG: hypothetical protein R2909_20935 [Gemmatimonadales bacterium]
MRRSLWSMVLLTVALLVAASMAQAPAQWRLGLAIAGKVLLRAGDMAFAAALAHWDWGVAVLAPILGAAAIAALRRRRRHRPAGHGLPWKEVTVMAREGRSVTTIARSTRLAQDAVRTMLVPVVREQPVPQGKRFRQQRPRRPARRPDPASSPSEGTR